MSAPDRQQRIAALRDSIANIERKPPLAETLTLVDEKTDGFPTLAGGLFQEIFTDERRNGGASLGFALAQARSLLSQQRLAVIYLQLVSDSQEMGLLYAPGMLSFGFDPDALVFIRPTNIGELLWAAEEALACAAVAAVIADVAGQPKMIDFTVSRRLNMRAEANGVTMFMLRYGAWREASAAQLRWNLLPAISAELEFDARAPGERRWRAQLEKGFIAGQQGQEWLLEWTQNGFQNLAKGMAPNRPAGRATVFGPSSSQLANRLLQTA